MRGRATAAPAIEMASSSSGVSPLVPMAPTTWPSTTSGIPPVERDGAVQGEGAEPTGRHLGLDLAARANEDRRRAGLVDGHAGAGRLRARRLAQMEQRAAGVDDGDDDAVAVLDGVLLGGGGDELDAGAVEGEAGAGGVHEGAPDVRRLDGCRRSAGRTGPLVASTAAQIAVSVVMNRTLRPRSAEREVDGAGDEDLAEQVAVGRVHEHAGRRRDVDPAGVVDLEPVGDAGRGDGEQPAPGEPAPADDVERHDVVRTVDVEAAAAWLAPLSVTYRVDAVGRRGRCRWAGRSRRRRRRRRRSPGPSGTRTRRPRAAVGSPAGGRRSGR